MYTNPSNLKTKKRAVIGRRIGSLVVTKREVAKYVCQCDCGSEQSFWRSNLLQGKKIHCGCKKYAGRDLTGKVFGRLTIVSKHKGSFERWECSCRCGGSTISTSNNLKKDNGTQSCGCLQKERAAEAGRANRYLTDEEREERQYRDNTLIKEWRGAVYERDDYTCQKCCTRGGELRAHHKDCWCNHTERRFDESNGVTLCVGCHNEIHHIFGKRTIEANWLEFQSSRG